MHEKKDPDDQMRKVSKIARLRIESKGFSEKISSFLG